MFSEAESLLILSSLPALKNADLKKILNICNSASSVISASKDYLEARLGLDISEKILDWPQQKMWQNELAEIERGHITLISILDQDYPPALKELKDPPLLLYIKGKIQGLPTLSIVGTRHATLYGRETAETISSQIAKENIAIVSGFAEGIDRAAHKGALNHGFTYAVLGSGFNHVYPQSNKDLLSLIEAKGALISEFSPNTPPLAYHFPKRNRIVSALGKALFVAETPLKGGSMITVEESLKLGKKIFTLPGRVDYESFSGNHHLIKTRKAELVENSSDILKGMGIDIEKEPKKALNFCFLSADEKKLYDLLPNEEKSIDELVLLTQFPIMQLNVLLTRLLLKKAVKEYPGKLFKKL